MTLHNRSEQTQKALLEFSFWVKHSMCISIQNVLVLKQTSPLGLKNPILLFVVPRAMNYVVERFSVEIVQAWELLNIELKSQKKRTLGISNKDYRHLKRIRNKLIAHKIEENLKTDNKHENWYKKSYGNFENVLALLARVANRIADKIDQLEATGNIAGKSLRTNAVTSFTATDVEALLAAVKARDIY